MKKVILFFTSIIMLVLGANVCYAEEDYIKKEIVSDDTNITLNIIVNEDVSLYGFRGLFDYDSSILSFDGCSSDIFNATLKNNVLLLEGINGYSNRVIATCNFSVIDSKDMATITINDISISNGENVIYNNDIVEEIDLNSGYEETEEQKNNSIIKNDSKNVSFIVISIVILALIVVFFIVNKKYKFFSCLIIFAVLILPTISFAIDFNVTDEQIREIRSILLNKNIENNHDKYDYDKDNKLTINDLIIGLISFNNNLGNNVANNQNNEVDISINNNVDNGTKYKVNITYSVNEGIVTKVTENGIWDTTPVGILYNNAELYKNSIDYGLTTDSSGLLDYNNPTGLNITRIGYSVLPGAEWKCIEGCTIEGKVFNQNSIYKASDFCDASKEDCTVVLGVNWKQNRVFVKYKVNGGTISSNSFDNSWNIKDDFIYQGDSLYQTKIYYGRKMEDYGIIDYNNPAGLNINKDDHNVPAGAEWKCIEGCTIEGKIFNQNTIYKASDFCDASKGDCTVVLGVNWKQNISNDNANDIYNSGVGTENTNKYKVNIKYNVNEGIVTKVTDNGTWETDEAGIIYKNDASYSQSVNYDKKTESSGLLDYNNKSWLNIKRTGYNVPKGAEWKCIEGCTEEGRTFNQTSKYKASDFCDASKGDCTVVLGVNWKQNPSNNNSENNVKHKVNIKYSVNGGIANRVTDNGTWTTDETGIIYKNDASYSQSVNYDKKTESSGLLDYNNPSWLNIKRTGYNVPKGAEWKCIEGCTEEARTFNQTSKYKASDFCDASKGDCTVVLGVNWKPNKVNIKYDVNEGSVTKVTNNGIWTTDKKGIVYKNNKMYIDTANYEKSTGSWGLLDYNNKSWLFVTRTGYNVPAGSEWKCKEGCAEKGKELNQNSIYKSSDLCDTSNGNCTVVLEVNWKPNKVNIKYSVNEGIVTKVTDNGTWTTDETGIIYKNDASYSQSVNYDKKTESSGLLDYNNKSWLNIKRTGYNVPKGAEWKCIEGCTEEGKTFNQTSKYKASDFCDASKGDCTVVLGVNWKQNPSNNNSENNVKHKVNIKYSVNGGIANRVTDNGTWTIDEAGIIYKNNEIYIDTANYEKSTGSWGLLDYNNPSWLYVTKEGYNVTPGFEWKCKEGCIQKGKVFNQKNSYNSSDFCDASKGDCTVVLEVNWKPNKVNIKYDVNGGTVTKITNNGTWTTDRKGIIYKNNEVYIDTANYEKSTGSWGLLDYNNKSWLYVTKEGYNVTPGFEWKCKEGCTEKGKVFNQKTSYNSSDFCDASRGDCTVVLEVNWKPNKVNIKYSVNGGIVNGGTLTAHESGFVYKNNELYNQGINYGSNTDRRGLLDYNNPSWLNLTKAGYNVTYGSEWKCKDGCTQKGRVFNQNIKYNSSDFCDASKGDCTVVLEVNWKQNPSNNSNVNKKHKVNIKYNVNGGIVNGGTLTADKSGIVLKNNKIYTDTAIYQEKTGSFGLLDYNNPSWLNVTKAGYYVKPGEEWKCKEGCIEKGRVFNQKTSYYSSDFCDASKSDCTVVLEVNWKQNPSNNNNVNKKHKVNIKYNVNGGIVNGGTLTADKSGIVLKNNKIYTDTAIYQEKTGSFGLLDYNNPSWLNVTKAGYYVKPGEEWKCKEGCIEKGRVFNQKTSYYSSDFCDASKSDCTVILEVNWKQNLDNKPPVISSCTAIIKDNKTYFTINTNDSDISRYEIKGQSYYSNNEYDVDSVITQPTEKNYKIDKIIEKPIITVYDKSGNSSKKYCTWYYEPISPKGTEDIKYSDNRETLKVWVERTERGSRTPYYTSHVWVKDAYEQFKVQVPDNYGKELNKPSTMMENAIRDYGLQNKLAIGVNASSFVQAGTIFNPGYYAANPKFNNTSTATVVIVNGVIKRDLSAENLPSNPYWPYPVYGLNKYGRLDYTSFYEGKDSRNVGKKDNIMSKGWKNTFSFHPILVTGGNRNAHSLDNDLGSKANWQSIRQAICQIDKNNFVFITDVYKDKPSRDGFTFNELANYMVDLGCETGFNLDGGESVALLYKNPNKTTLDLVPINGNARYVADIIFFHEQ